MAPNSLRVKTQVLLVAHRTLYNLPATYLPSPPPSLPLTSSVLATWATLPTRWPSDGP